MINIENFASENGVSYQEAVEFIARFPTQNLGLSFDEVEAILSSPKNDADYKSAPPQNRGAMALVIRTKKVLELAAAH